jgi:hypothetical protein
VAPCVRVAISELNDSLLFCFKRYLQPAYLLFLSRLGFYFADAKV